MDGARTRLTHSFEVAHIGTYIVAEIFKGLDKGLGGKSANILPWKHFGWEERQAVRSFVEVACLVHDIGNPPFGHFGEKAICNWLRLNTNEAWFTHATKRPELVYDLTGFDGNKQGFRILTKLQRNAGDQYGLNLTGTQLAATIKYPLLDEGAPSKCSYFLSEQAVKDEVWKNLKMAAGQRHPLSLIMEAADDIAYCVSDLEDAAEKGLITASDLEEAFGTRNSDFGQLSTGITEARTNLTNHMVALVAQTFINRLKDRTEYETRPILKENAKLDKLRAIAKKKVYSSRIVLSNEITGYKVIQGLLDAFLPLLEMEEKDFVMLAAATENRQSIYEKEFQEIVKLSTAEPSLLSLFPRKHLAVYRDAVSEGTYPELFHRIHLVVDFIAGMTDDFALSTYRLLSGQVTYGKQ